MIMFFNKKFGDLTEPEKMTCLRIDLGNASFVVDQFSESVNFNVSSFTWIFLSSSTAMFSWISAAAMMSNESSELDLERSSGFHDLLIGKDAANHATSGSSCVGSMSIA